MVRMVEFTGGGVEPTFLDPCNIDANMKNIRDLTTSIPVGAQGVSPPIATFFEQVDTPELHKKNVYFHGFLEFSDASGRLRGRTGFCFVYLPKIKSRGFCVAFPKNTEKHWYYEKIE